MAVVGELEVSEKELCPHSNDPKTCPICNPGLAKQIAKTTGPGVNATPAVRKLAKDLGVDISVLKGTGPGGIVTQDDVVKASKQGTTKQSVPQALLQTPPEAGG